MIWDQRSVRLTFFGDKHGQLWCLYGKELHFNSLTQSANGGGGDCGTDLSTLPHFRNCDPIDNDGSVSHDPNLMHTTT